MAEASQTWALRPKRDPIAIDRVEAAIEVGGDLTVVDENKVKRLKLEVVANLNYDERTFDQPVEPDKPLHSMRHYRAASAAISVEGATVRPTLSEDRRLIGVQVTGADVTLFSPAGSLTRDELDLIDSHGNSLLLDRLLPDKPVAIGSTWEHPENLVAALLRLEAVNRADVQSKLAKVENGIALVETEGDVSGAIGGVSTEINLKAKYQFNLSSGRIVWFGLLVREKRSVGHVAPGLDVVARLQMSIGQISDSPRLSNAALRNLSLVPTDELTRIRYESPEGGLQFFNDRRWFVTGDEYDRAVLRLIDRGELVAQLNIAPLDKVDPAKLIDLTRFQDDVRRGLGDNFGQFVSAAQRPNQANYRVFEVVVDGQSSDVPIRWIYYMLADQFGRQAVFAFVVEGNLIDRFGTADEELLETVRLIDRKIAAIPDRRLQ
jgi:hypothetical protein